MPVKHKAVQKAGFQIVTYTTSNMDVSPKSGNYAIRCTLKFSARISHTCEKAIKQGTYKMRNNLKQPTTNKK